MEDYLKLNIPGYFSYILLIAISVSVGNLKSQSSDTPPLTTIDSIPSIVDKYIELSRKALTKDVGKSLSLALRAKKLSIKVRYKKGVIDSYNNIGNCKEQLGKYDEAKEYYYSALRFTTINSYLRSETLNNIAIIHFIQGDRDSCMAYLIRSQKILIQLNLRKELGINYSNIGNLYIHFGDNEKALEYYRKSLDIHKEQNDSSGIGIAMYNIGNVYNMLNNYSEAIEYYKESNIFFKRVEDRRREANVYGSLGRIYALQSANDENMINMAKESIERALEIYVSIGDELNIGMCSRHLAEFYCTQKNYLSAILYANKSLSKFKALGLKDKMFSSCEQLLIAQIKNNKDNEVLKSYHLLKSIMDSLNIEENKKVTMEMESKYESEKKEQKIALLNKEKQLQSTRLTLVIVIAVLSLLATVSIYQVVQSRRKSKYERELNLLREFKLKVEAEKSREKLTSIPISSGKKKVRFLELGEAAYFFTQKPYTFICADDGNSHIVDYSLRSLEDVLPENFYRVHNSYIINLEKVKEITRTYNGKVLFSFDFNSPKVPSSIKYKDNVREMIKGKNI